MLITHQEKYTPLQRLLDLSLPGRRQARYKAQKRLRQQVREMLFSLDALQRDIYIAHYDPSFPERGIDLGGREIRKLVSLGMQMPLPVPRTTQSLQDTWEISRRLLREKPQLSAVDAAMDDLRADLQRILVFYRD